MRCLGVIFSLMLLSGVVFSGVVRGEDKEEGVAKQNVVFETNQGVIEIKLFDDVAPKACENFRGLAKKGYYDGTIFHRVIPGFMVQGGDPTGTGRGGESLWGADFADEVSPAVQFDRKGFSPWPIADPLRTAANFLLPSRRPSG